MRAHIRCAAIHRAVCSLALCISCVASCSAADDVPGASIGPSGAHATAASSPRVSTSTPPPGTGPTPIDREIAGDWPPRPWSKNVPDRECTNDNECGDGFCDRGKCAPIWTWTHIYGQRCDALQLYHPRYACPAFGSPMVPRCDLMPTSTRCGGYLCLDDRCRSCESNDECEKLTGSPGAVCTAPGQIAAGRGCANPPWPDRPSGP
jgi:hypothetical protein